MQVDLIRQFIDLQLPNLNWLQCKCQKKKSFYTSLLPSFPFGNLSCFKTALEQHSRFIFQGSFILKPSQCTSDKVELQRRSRAALRAAATAHPVLSEAPEAHQGVPGIHCLKPISFKDSVEFQGGLGWKGP